MVNADTPNSPGWWLTRLLKRLGENRTRVDRLAAYYAGDAALPALSSKSAREAYVRLMSIARTNFAELVVEAVRERMMPVGFRTGAEGDQNGDDEAWRIWQANGLDADAALIFRTQLALADAFVIVGGVDPDIEVPLITVEDPRQVIVEEDPVRRRRRRAALKVFTDDVEGVDVAHLFLPGFVFKAFRTHAPDTGQSFWDATGWEWRTDTPERLPQPVVPVVRFANRPDMFGASTGEFEPHLPLLDRINYGVLSRLEIATLQAFRQRAIEGDLPEHDPEGNIIDYDDIFAADPGALWRLPNGVKIWESGQIDLGPLREAVKDDVRDLSAVTRTPMYLFTPDAASGSAEGASLLREGLNFKALDRIAQASESLEEVLSLAFLFAGDDERASRRDMEVLWRPPALFSLSERADAAVKASSSGVPWRTVMADIWQFSPQAIDRLEGERAAELVEAQAAGTMAALVSGTTATGEPPAR